MLEVSGHTARWTDILITEMLVNLSRRNYFHGINISFNSKSNFMKISIIFQMELSSSNTGSSNAIFSFKIA